MTQSDDSTGHEAAGLSPQAPAADLPCLQQPARGQRGRLAQATPAPALTPRQRLHLLDAWRRSSLPAGDFAPLCGVSSFSGALAARENERCSE